MDYRRQIRFSNLPKDILEDVDAVEDYMGQGITKLLLVDIILAIRSLRSKIPPDRIIEPKNKPAKNSGLQSN